MLKKKQTPILWTMYKIIQLHNRLFFCCVMTVCVITMLSLDGTDENGDVEEKRGGKKIERLNDAQKEEA